MPTPYISRLKLEKELEKKARMLREKKSKCEEYMGRLQKILDVLKEWGDISDLLASFQEAKKSYEIRDYEDALQKFQQVETEVKKLSRERYGKERKNIEKMLKRIRGEDIDEIKELLKILLNGQEYLICW